MSMKSRNVIPSLNQEVLVHINFHVNDGGLQLFVGIVESMDAFPRHDPSDIRPEYLPQESGTTTKKEDPRLNLQA